MRTAHELVDAIVSRIDADRIRDGWTVRVELHPMTTTIGLRRAADALAELGLEAWTDGRDVVVGRLGRSCPCGCGDRVGPRRTLAHRECRVRAEAAGHRDAWIAAGLGMVSDAAAGAARVPPRTRQAAAQARAQYGIPPPSTRDRIR